MAIAIVEINNKPAAVIIRIKTRYKKPNLRKRRKMIQETVIKARINVSEEQLLILRIKTIIFPHSRHPPQKAAVDRKSIPQEESNE